MDWEMLKAATIDGKNNLDYSNFHVSNTKTAPGGSLTGATGPAGSNLAAASATEFVPR